MAGKNHGSSGSTTMPNKVDQQLKQYLEEVLEPFCEEIQNLCDLAQTQKESAVKTADIKHTAWKKARGAYEEYTNVKQQISIKLGQTKDELVENIGHANASFAKVTTYFKESVTCIKDVQKEFINVVAKANLLDQAIKNHCNKPEFNEIEKKIKLKEKSDNLKQLANDICNKAGENFDAAVIASGIHAQLHLSGLVSAGGEIDTCVKQFTEGVEANLIDAEGKAKTTRQAYDEAIKARCKAEDDLKMLQLQLVALLEAKQYVKPSYSRPHTDTLEQILQEAEKNYLPPDAKKH